MEKDNQLSVKVDDELFEMIEEERDALPYNVDRSEVIRKAIREYLEGNAARSQPVRAD